MEKQFRKFPTRKQAKYYLDFWIPRNTLFVEYSRVIKCINGDGSKYWICQFTRNKKPIRQEVIGNKVYEYREWCTICNENQTIAMISH